MNKFHLVLAAGILCWGAIAANAQTMKPGLWEISTKSVGGSGEMEKAMAESQKHINAMSPAQRKTMEEMMSQQGIKMGQPGGGILIKMCMTKEMIDRNEVTRHEGKCTQTSSQKAGNTLKFTVVCAEPPSTSEGQVDFISPEAYRTKITSRTTRQGKPESIVMESHSKFLSSDCGAIKPLSLPTK